MIAEKIGPGILVGIFTGTFSTILGGIILLGVEHRSPWFRDAEPPQSEKKSTLCEVVRESSARQPVPQPSGPSLAPDASPHRLGQLARQQEEIEALKRGLAQLKRHADGHHDSVRKPWDEGLFPADKRADPESVSRRSGDLSLAPQRERIPPSNRNAAPPPALVPVYYRVASMRTRQIEDGRVEEVVDFLKRLKITCTRGRDYKDSGLGPRYVPIAIQPTSS